MVVVGKTQTAKPFTDSKEDLGEMKRITRDMRTKRPVDVDIVYGRLLATPTWYYANGAAVEFKRVLKVLAGDTGGGVPLYASLLR